MAPSRIAPLPPPQGHGQDLARVIEAMAAALKQQSNAMLQQHEATMQRQEASFDQQHLVMQQMENKLALLDASWTKQKLQGKCENNG